MSDAHGWVLLVECHNVTELHALRAALEARGVPCRVEGEHTHGIMGAFHGAAVRSRVMVPALALKVARELAEDIVGPFDEQPTAGDDPRGESPFRRPGELVAEDEDEPEDEPAASSLRPKSYTRLLLVVLLGLGPFLGLGHVYIGRNARAGVLVLVTILSLPSAIHGALWALLALAGVWLADVGGCAFGIAAHNRRVQAAQIRAETTSPALAAPSHDAEARTGGGS